MSKCQEEFDMLSMTQEDFFLIKDSFMQKKKETKVGGGKAEKSDLVHLGHFQTLMGKLEENYQQDFKPWTDRIETPKTEGQTEKVIEKLKLQVAPIQANVDLNMNLRQTVLAISQH